MFLCRLLLCMILITAVGCKEDIKHKQDTIARPNVDEGIGTYLESRFASNQGDVTKAIESLDALLALKPNDVALLRQRLRLAMYSPKTLNTVTPLARRLLTLEKSDFLGNLLLVTGAVQAGKFSEASGYLDGLDDENFQKLFRPLLNAWLAAGRGDGVAAQEALAVAGQTTEIATLAGMHRALIFSVQGDARKALDAALALPKNGSLRVQALQGALARRAGATISLEDFTLNADDAPRAAYQMTVRDAVMAGDFQAVGLPPAAAQGVGQVFFDIASLFSQEKSKDVALVFARLALELMPDFTFANMLIVDLLGEERGWEAALTFNAQVPEKSPFWPLVQLRSAEMEQLLGRPLDAERRLVFFLERFPKNVSALSDMAALYRRQEDFARAFTYYDKAIALTDPANPTLWALLHGRGICSERLKNWPAAEADFQKALAIRPNEPHVLNYLAYSWIERGEKLEESLRMLETAVELAPRDGYIVDSLGWAHYRLGRYSLAVKYLERAVEIAPGDATLNDHLGDAYWKIGRTREALFQWQRALDFTKKTEDSIALQKKIAHRAKGEESAPVNPDLRNSGSTTSAPYGDGDGANRGLQE